MASAWVHQFWVNWTAPVAGEPQDAGHEYSTRAVTLILAGVLAPVTAASVLIWLSGLISLTDVLLTAVMALLAAAAFLLVKNGRWKAARWLTAAAFLFPGMAATLRSGLIGEALVFYSLAILLACIQLPPLPRWGILVGIVLFHTLVSAVTTELAPLSFIFTAAVVNGGWIGLAVLFTLSSDYQKKLLANAHASGIKLQDEIQDRTRAEQALRENQVLLNAVINNLPFDFWVCDSDNRYILQNATFERHWGRAIGKSPNELDIPTELRLRWLVKNERALSGEIVRTEEAQVHADGSGYYYALLAPVRLGNEIIGCLGMNLDITDRKRAEEALRENEERLRQVLQNMPVMLNVFNENNRVIVWNRECEMVTGYSAEELRNHPDPLALLYPDPEYRRQMLVKIKELQYNFRELEFDLTCKTGVVKTISWSNLSERFPVPGWFNWSVGIDVTERKLTEQRLRYWGHHDSLTSLFNRSYFNEELNRLRNSRQFPVSIIMMDVDDLKSVNDTMGHPQGDKLLRQAAAVLSGSFRGEDVIARIGGDEFAVLLPHTNHDEAYHAVERLKQNLRIHNQAGGQPQLGLSIGYATAENGYTLQEAYDQSDINMYKDKSLRKKTGPLRGWTA